MAQKAFQENQFEIVTGPWEYRNREDQTILKPSVLVVGSQNVVTNTAARLQLVKGYTLDGPASAIAAPILGAYDFDTTPGYTRILRAYFNPTTSKGVLQVRNDASGTITWLDLIITLNSADLNFCDFYDFTTEKLNLCLFVDGSDNIYEWSGGMTTFASATANTLTKEGVTTWAEEGFLAAGTRKVLISGQEYTYTGGEGTTTLTGVTPGANGTDQSQTTQDAVQKFGETNLTTKVRNVAQSFVAGTTSIDGIKLYKAADTGTPTAGFAIVIQADVAGVPSGVNLASANVALVDYLALPIGEFTINFATTGVISAGQTYWIVVKQVVGNDDSNHFNLGCNSAGGYASGSVKGYNTADGWTPISTVDLYFKTFKNLTIPVGTPVIQSVRTTANSGLTAFPATFGNALIANIRNQIYVGSKTLRSIYISKVNNYKDYGYATPRVVGTGSLVTLDGNPTALIPQEDAMYMSAGKNQWYRTKWTLSADLANESFEVERLKTAQNQGAQSQAMVAKDKNNITFVSYEPILTTLGRVEGILGTPQMGDISYAIVNDMNSYDFTDACVKYWKNFIFVAIPSKGLIRIYNQTDPNRHYWEAPVTYAISRFYEVGGAIYGHSYNSPESYKLFEGYNFNGQPIPALAVFAYQNYGAREKTKGLNEIYVEGYINENTTLNLGMKKEMDGCSSESSFEIGGDDSQIVCIGGSNAPLGKEAIGKNPFGGDLSEATLLPPKFRVIKTMPQLPDFYEVQFSLYNVNIDAQWEIIGFGPRLLPISTTNTHIKQ